MRLDWLRRQCVCQSFTLSLIERLPPVRDISRVVVLVASCAACGEDHRGQAPESDAGYDAEDGGAAAWLPAVCRDVQAPLLNSPCLQGLSESCSAHTTEQACSMQQTLNIDNFEFRCGWARVIQFARPEECGGMSTAGQCVAAFLDNVQGCGNPCANLDAPNMWDSFTFTSRGELVEKPCGPRQTYLSPVPTAGSCTRGQAEPLCKCAAAACMSP